ncbi:MAG: 30S ribosomal protein S4 [Nanoarchaeota archaeon]|nr:30S ribosomal protein S4 [Nanoarchaeota archaeon]MBU1004402.1 30S ribosomal protein S4 [Nanoarchaeota archaeon]MBU1946711.1 30S ribosomal protein S4 [Nanoarchaeota archaeon]
MGHPKLKRKTYSGPTHPWQKERIEEEKELLTEFGLKNKTEIWRVSSLLRKYARQAKKLITLDTPQAEKEQVQLLRKLSSLGLISESAKLEDVLTLTLKEILARRLQTVVYKNKLAKSIRQARQFITHSHIMIKDKPLTVPSYLVSKQEEALISFSSTSALSSQDHPERLVHQEPAVKESAEDKKEEKKEKKPDHAKFKKEKKSKKQKEEAKEKKEEPQKAEEEKIEKKEEPTPKKEKKEEPQKAEKVEGKTEKENSDKGEKQ